MKKEKNKKVKTNETVKAQLKSFSTSSDYPSTKFDSFLPKEVNVDDTKAEDFLSELDDKKGISKLLFERYGRK